MIHGEVSADREPEIEIWVRSWNGAAIQVRATVDTGFSGYLSLPLEYIERLQLPFIESRDFGIGDGTDERFDIFAARADWDGLEREIEILASAGRPALGTSLLYGFRMLVDFIDGGKVIIEARP